MSELTAKIKTVEEVSKKLNQEFENALAIHAMLAGANKRKFLRVFNNTYEANGLNIITHTLLNGLILNLIKIHDNFDENSKRTHNRASLPHISYLLSQPAIESKLVATARAWNPMLDRADRDADLMANLIRRVKRGNASFQKGPRKLWLKTLRDHRNKHLAHILFQMKPVELAKYRYIEQLLRATGPIIQDLCSVAGIGHYDWKDSASVHKQQADTFWHTVKLGMWQKVWRA